MEPDSEWLAFAAMLAEQAAIAIDNAALFEDLRRSNEELKVAYDSTIEGWCGPWTCATAIPRGIAAGSPRWRWPARDMGLGEAELVHIRRGALLHDMGKLGVPDAILHKPGPLSEEEWVVMRRHPSYAVEILGPIEFLGPALEIPHYHHERLGRDRLPLRTRGRADPAGGSHLRGGGHLGCLELRPPLSPSLAPGPGSRAPAQPVGDPPGSPGR